MGMAATRRRHQPFIPLASVATVASRAVFRSTTTLSPCSSISISHNNPFSFLLGFDPNTGLRAVMSNRGSLWFRPVESAEIDSGGALLQIATSGGCSPKNPTRELLSVQELNSGLDFLDGSAGKMGLVRPTTHVRPTV